MKNPPLQQGHDGPRAPPLRPYQADTLQRMKSYEGNAALCVIATGLGKTRIFAEYIRCDVLENDHHILILSHREELVIQPLEYLKGLPCGIEQGTTHAHGEPIISASVQSLVGRLDKYNPYSIDTIIIDEAHHSAAPTYRKIFEYFKNAVRFGFTATAIRGDGVGLDVAFDDILCEYNTLYGIEHGYLSPIEACQVNLKYDLGTVQYREDTGDYDAADEGHRGTVRCLLQPPLPADRPALPGPLQIPACHNQRLLPAGTALYPPQPGRCRNGAGYAGLPVEQLH